LGESEAASGSKRISDFTANLKLSNKGQRIVSLDATEYNERLRVLAWRVRWVLSVRIEGNRKSVRARASVLATFTASLGKTSIVCRRQIVQLLQWPKSDFEHLAIKLPCLMAFRPEEVCTWRAEYIDWENGETQVLDAKKHKLFTVPLNGQIARHARLVLAGRTDGYVLQGRTRHSPAEDKPLTPTAIWFIWHKQVQLAVGAVPAPISPVVGRRFFAYEFYHRQPENLVELQVIMRHSDPGITLIYVRGLVCWDNVKDAYDRFQFSGFDGVRKPSSFSLSSCLHFASCRQAVEGCFCRMFQPSIEEVKSVG